MTPASRLPTVAPSTESPHQVTIALPYQVDGERGTQYRHRGRRHEGRACAVGEAGDEQKIEAGSERAAAEAAARRARRATRVCRQL